MKKLLLVLFVFNALQSIAQTKVSEMLESTDAADEYYVPIVRDGQNRKTKGKLLGKIRMDSIVNALGEISNNSWLPITALVPTTAVGVKLTFANDDLFIASQNITSIAGGDSLRLGVTGTSQNIYFPQFVDATGDSALRINSSGKLVNYKIAAQTLDQDLIDIGSLSPTNDDIIQRKAGAWTNRSITQYKTDLALTKSDVGLSNIDNITEATRNAQTATLTNKTLTAPVINSPTGIVKGDVGLGSVDNTPDASKPISTATQTALNGKANTSHSHVEADVTKGQQTVVLTGSNVSNSTTSYSSIAGLSFPVSAGNAYRFRFVITYTAPVATTGSRFSITGPTAGGTVVRYRGEWVLNETTRYPVESLQSFDAPATPSSSSSASTDNCIAYIEGTINAGSSGTVTARFASEVGGSAIIVQSGVSYVEWKQLN